MKVFPVDKIRDLDAYTIEEEGIPSIELMERASRVFCQYFMELFPNTDRPVYIFAGIGNNGGDGLAVARLLFRAFYPVRTFITRFSSGMSEDCEQNYERLPKRGLICSDIHEGDAFPEIPNNAVIIDAMFGSGLSRPIEGYWAELVQYLNNHEGPIVSVDMPSGMFADQPTDTVSIEADYTLSFELPKKGFFFAENSHRTGKWTVRSIGLSKKFIEKEICQTFFLEKNMLRQIHKHRKQHAHKGNFGHACLICGSHRMVGAAIMSTRACLRSGAGLVTCHVPKFAHPIMHMSIPEAMISPDPHEQCFSTVPDLSDFDTIGAGCGLGTNPITAQALRFLLDACSVPMVLDADALNLIGKYPNMKKLIPPNSILTPHPKEFERVFGQTDNSFERLDLQLEKSRTHQCIIVVKGAYTCITTPEGITYFNSTGNPGMATAGSGDVLTGILTGLLAQGYRAEEAAILGVYLHGLAGDLAVREQEHEALIAGDIIKHLGHSFQALKTE